MGAVGVPGGVHVVLEKVHRAAGAILGQFLLELLTQVVHDQLTGHVLGDHVLEGGGLRAGVLRVRTHVEVEPAPIGEKHVGCPAPREHGLEEAPRGLVGSQAVSMGHTVGDAELGFDAVDSAVHELTGRPSGQSP